MLITQQELDLIQNPRFHRRMMRLPALENRCPLQEGHPYRLKAKGKQASVRITIAMTRREQLEALSLNDAKKEGYASTKGAIEAFIRVHGEHDEVWVIAFVRGDESAFFRQGDPVYLRRGGGYTTLWDELDAGEVTIAPGAGERARIAALVARQAPARAAIGRAKGEIETLKGSMLAMKANNRARLIAKEAERMDRQLNKLQSELPACDVVRSGQPLALGSADSSEDRADTATPVVSLEAA